MIVSARLRAIARETLAILDAGGYSAPGGGRVPLAAATRAAVEGTRLYRPDDAVEPPALRGAIPVVGAPPTLAATPVVEVTGESTLAASRRLAGAGPVAALVFASAKNPGGGFRTGAQAQEESVARASALYRCLTAAPGFYAFHRAQGDVLYSDRVIHSPRVPVFRADDGALLDAAYEVSFLTAAAPNRRALPRGRAGQVAAVLARRSRRVLAVAAAHGHRRIVLGAWGCGVFGNDPVTVADAFAGALRESAGWFDRVVFAVQDRTAAGAVHDAFAARFTADGAPSDHSD